MDEGIRDHSHLWQYYRRIADALKHTAISSSTPLLQQTISLIEEAPHRPDMDVFSIRDFPSEGGIGIGLLDIALEYPKDRKPNIAHMTEIGKALLSRGCPPHQRSETGWTPSQRAAKLGAVTLLADMLRRAKADPLLLDDEGNNLFHLVVASPAFVASSDPDAMYVIDQCLADPHMASHRNAKGETPLQTMVKQLTYPPQIHLPIFRRMISEEGRRGLDKNEFHALCRSLMDHPSYLVDMLKITRPELSAKETLDVLNSLIRKYRYDKQVWEQPLSKWLAYIEKTHEHTPFNDQDLAHAMPEREPQNDIHYVRLAKLMRQAPNITALQAIECEWPKTFHAALEHGALVAPHKFIHALVLAHGTSDMLAEFARRVLTPAIMLEAGFDAANPKEAEAMEWMAGLYDYNQHNRAQYEKLLHVFLAPYGDLSQPENAQRAYTAITNISRTWHHPTIVFPNELIEFHGRNWVPILSKPWTASNGYEIECLTTSRQLEETSEALGHCIRDYTSNCCHPDHNQRSHILNVKDPNGTLVATMELKFGRHSCLAHHEELCLTQLEGKKIKGERDLIYGGPIFDAAKELLQCPFLRKDGLGETQQSQKNLACPKIIYDAGYIPTRETLQKAFDEFRHVRRRGAISVSKTNTLVYTNAPGSHESAAQHLIDGMLDVPQPDGTTAVKSAREATVDEWLDATGLRQGIRDYIRQHSPALAEARESVWNNQVETPKIVDSAAPVRELPKPVTTGEKLRLGIVKWFRENTPGTPN